MSVSIGGSLYGLKCDALREAFFMEQPVFIPFFLVTRLHSSGSDVRFLWLLGKMSE